MCSTIRWKRPQNSWTRRLAASNPRSPVDGRSSPTGPLNLPANRAVRLIPTPRGSCSAMLTSSIAMTGMAFGAIDGEPVLLVLFQRGDQWQVAWPVRVHVAGRVIDRIEDYYACPWVIGNASESDLKLMTGPVVLRGA